MIAFYEWEKKKRKKKSNCKIYAPAALRRRGGSIVMIYIRYIYIIMCCSPRLPGVRATTWFDPTRRCETKKKNRFPRTRHFCDESVLRHDDDATPRGESSKRQKACIDIGEEKELIYTYTDFESFNSLKTIIIIIIIEPTDGVCS